MNDEDVLLVLVLLIHPAESGHGGGGRGGGGGGGDEGGGCWLVEEQDRAAWRGSSRLAGAQLVLNHSERSASAFHSQLTSGLCVCVCVCVCVLGASLPHQPPHPTSHPACRCVMCSQGRWRRWRRWWWCECDLPTPRVQTGSRAKAGAELPAELGDPSVHRSSPDTLQPLTAAWCQHVCVCVCVCEQDL